MGIYSEYLNRGFNFPGLERERKEQLKRIADLRGRDVLVIAANLMNFRAPITIDYSDLLPIGDQLSNFTGRPRALDLILETPGGSGEIAEEIIRIIRSMYDDLAVIVPGCAKSAGTIMAMAADDILMGPQSALGPVDAQISNQGKVFSADAFLDGVSRIMKEVKKTGRLNAAYIPILQAISPGELEHARNALALGKTLVQEWLATYKFKNWKKHSSSGKLVTDRERKARAATIARAMCDQERWKSHGRSIRISDLESLRLRITDYSRIPDLTDALQRYYALVHLTFETNVYKLFETPGSQVYRFLQPAGRTPRIQPGDDSELVAFIDTNCPKCGTQYRVQACVGSLKPLEKGAIPFPKGDKLSCPNCSTIIDLSVPRAQIEAQAKRPVVT